MHSLPLSIPADRGRKYLWGRMWRALSLNPYPLIMDQKKIGRGLFTLNALIAGAGGFLADWNTTHLFNPRWPPHARFHDAQTMAAGVVLGAASLFFAWRRGGDPSTNWLAATLFGGTLWVTQFAALFFPGSGWTDPEFLKSGQSLQQVAPQVYIDLSMTSLVLLAAWLARPQERPTARFSITTSPS